MKFGEKIFLSTLIIFEIFFVPASIYLINSNFRLNLKLEINSGISEQNRFCSSIESNLYLLKVQKASISHKTKIDKENINSMIDTYLSNLGEQDIYLDVIDENNNVVFNNFKINVPGNRDELKVVQNKVNYIIRDVGQKTYLFVTTKIDLDNNYYKVSYAKDISSIYNNRRYLLNLLLKLNLVISVILIIVSIILSKLIVNPINKLIKSTKTIASGNFGERVKVVSDDEIGVLSENFNAMAVVVEDKIHELERTSEDKQRFIDNLAHELKTPLTSIIGYADFLRTTRYDEETFISSLSFIYEEGKRLEELSFKLMDLIVLRKKDFNMKRENIQELFMEIKNALIPKLELKNIVLKISAINFSFLMDKDLMKLLITNLIDNSIKASKSGDEICLSAYKDAPSNIIIEVKDMGIGITKEDIPKVFEPFFMVDKSRTRANNGVGLGLSLCEEIARIHNAEIKIESELDKGTTIQIKFNFMRSTSF